MKSRKDCISGIIHGLANLSFKALRAVLRLVVILGSDARGEFLFELEKFFRKEVCWCKISVWKTITVGGYGSADEIRAALDANEYLLQEFAGHMLDRIPFSESPKKEVILVKMTVKEITGKDEARVPEILAGIRRIGGEICPPDLGPYLRLQVEKKRDQECFRIAMEPVDDKFGRPCIFGIREQFCDEPGMETRRHWLSASQGDYEYSGMSKFVFIYHPQKTE